MKTQNRFFFAMALAVVTAFTLSPLPSHAQQQATGQAGSQTNGQAGDSNNGGWNSGSSNAGYDAKDPNFAAGHAATKSAGTSNVVLGPHGSTVASKSTTSADTGAQGAKTSIGFDASASQGNWAATPDATTSANYADGGNMTTADSKGSMTGKGGYDCSTPDSISGGGQANAGGKTSVATTTTKNGVTSTADTSGASDASGAFKGKGQSELATKVGGTGGIDTGALVHGADGSVLGGYSTGTGIYSGAKSGALKANGATVVKMDPNGHGGSVSSSVSSQARAH